MELNRNGRPNNGRFSITWVESERVGLVLETAPLISYYWTISLPYLLSPFSHSFSTVSQSIVNGRCEIWPGWGLWWVIYELIDLWRCIFSLLLCRLFIFLSLSSLSDLLGMSSLGLFQGHSSTMVNNARQSPFRFSKVPPPSFFFLFNRSMMFVRSSNSVLLSSRGNWRFLIQAMIFILTFSIRPSLSPSSHKLLHTSLNSWPFWSIQRARWAEIVANRDGNCLWTAKEGGWSMIYHLEISPPLSICIH